MQQANMTLNIIRALRMNPKISACGLLETHFAYNIPPLELPGIKVMIHKKTQQQKSWALYGKKSWYIGPELEHYRCYRVYILETCSERISNTV